MFYAPSPVSAVSVLCHADNDFLCTSEGISSQAQLNNLPTGYAAVDCLYCSFDDATDGKLTAVLERIKSQQMLQTNVRRNGIGSARKIGKNFVYYRESMHKKEKSPLKKPIPRAYGAKCQA